MFQPGKISRSGIVRNGYPHTPGEDRLLACSCPVFHQTCATKLRWLNNSDA
jgi:hypothetical protein